MTGTDTLVPPDAEKRVDLVFEGGGVKGIALVGAFSVLEEQGFQFQNLAGTSAGAVVATLVAAGYRATEIRDIVAGKGMARFMDQTWLDRIPLIGPALSILKDEGVYEGKVFLEQMRQVLADKGIKTFGDLPPGSDPSDPRYRYKVQIIASDVTARALLTLPMDAAMLGIDDPDTLEVAEAVRMSMSIPIFFEPVWYTNSTTKEQHQIVDGGMLSNFPVWIFDSDGPPTWPTFGLKLVEAQPRNSLADALPVAPPHGGIEGVIDYIKGMVTTMMEAHDRQYLEQDQFVRTITIPTSGVSSTDFNLTPQQAQGLYDAGRAATGQFLQTWFAAGGFPAYVAAFRSGPIPTRRQRVAEVMRSAAPTG